MLIKCPECNKEISDKSNVCIHCGYPLHTITEKPNNICLIHGQEYDLTYVLPNLDNETDAKLCRYISDNCLISINNAMALYKK